ncbi:MAG: hypothetical protein RI900_1577 [Actinomycetota bacterium]
MVEPWCRPVDGGAVLTVRVVPGASRSGVLDVVNDAIRVRVCSPPVDGRANDELCGVLADALGLRPRQVVLVSGGQARTKRVRVELPADAVRSLLER